MRIQGGRSRWVIVLLAGSCLGQKQTPSIQQNSKGGNCSNIIALTGNVSINCSSLTPKQKKIIDGLPAILDKILANGIDSDLVLAKLDEILKRTNPNARQRSYFCNGEWSDVGRGGNSAFDVRMGGDGQDLKALIDLVNTNAPPPRLLEASERLIKLRPDWLTPFLFNSLAHVALKDFRKAKESRDHYETLMGGAYDVEPCIAILKHVNQQLSGK